MKRRRFSPAVKAQIIQRQGGNCPYCKRPLAASRVEYDHVIPLALGGDDSPGNLEAVHKVCHASFKTSLDRAQIAKADRQGQRTGQQARRAAGKTAQIPARPFGPSKGFDKRLRKRMDGTVEIRLGAEIER